MCTLCYCSDNQKWWHLNNSRHYISSQEPLIRSFFPWLPHLLLQYRISPSISWVSNALLALSNKPLSLTFCDSFSNTKLTFCLEANKSRSTDPRNSVAQAHVGQRYNFVNQRNSKRWVVLLSRPNLCHLCTNIVSLQCAWRSLNDSFKMADVGFGRQETDCGYYFIEYIKLQAEKLSNKHLGLGLFPVIFHLATHNNWFYSLHF